MESSSILLKWSKFLIVLILFKLLILSLEEMALEIV